MNHLKLTPAMGAVLAALTGWSCASGDGPGTDGSGGALATGGASSGGSVASGGVAPSVGGSASGGQLASGGVPQSGGQEGGGGAPLSGGTTGSGGDTPGTGGADGSGGAGPSSGGDSGAGGSPGSGGTTAGECVIGETKGTEVAVIGESFIAATHELTQRIEMNAREQGSLGQGESYIDNSVSGTTLAGNQIPSQYDDAVQESPDTIKYVLMDGGGNDCIFGDADAAYSAAESLFTNMAQNGTEKVVYFFYPDPIGSNWASLKSCLDGLRPRMKALCDGLTSPECFWLDQREAWDGHPEYTSDGIHPTTAGSNASGDAIWEVMVDNCVAQ